MSIIYEPSKTTHWRNLFESKSMLLGSHNLNEGEELVCPGHGILINLPNCTVNAMKDSPENPLIKQFMTKIEDGGIWVANA